MVAVPSATAQSEGFDGWTHPVQEALAAIRSARIDAAIRIPTRPVEEVAMKLG